MQNLQTDPMAGQVPPPPLAYKGVGIRFVALLIDWFILSVVLGLIAVALGSSSGACDSITYIGATLTVNGKQTFYGLCGYPAAIFMLGGFAYFILLEWLWGGTLGKLSLGIRVRTAADQPIGFKESLIRNLLRIIDSLPFCIPYLLGAILVWTSPEKQRLGDRAAGTIITSKRG